MHSPHFPWLLGPSKTPDLGGVSIMEVDVAGVHGIAILQDVKVGDEAIIVLVTFRGVGGVLNECGDLVFQLSDGVLEPGNL